MTVTLSPYGMATCCICDAPTTHAIPEDREDSAFLPYCAKCAKMVKDEFPYVKVLLYTPR